MTQVKFIPIIPRRIDYQKYLAGDINATADKAAQDMEQGYNDIQKDFHKKARIHRVRTTRPDKVIVQVYYLANDGILSILDLGAKPHPIVAKNAPYLVFRRDYHPATKPKEGLGYPKLATHQRAYSDGHIVKKVAVDHPGVDPRGYTEGLINFWRKEWHRRMTETVWRAVRKAK